MASPADAVAVAVNLTGKETDSETFFSVLGQGSPGPSTLNISAGEDRATQSLVRIGDDGAIRVVLHHGQGHALLAVAGAFVTGDAGSRYAALATPARLLDTRAATPPAPLGPGGIVTVPAGDLPSGATAAAVNLTDVQPSVRSFLSAWSHDLPYTGIPSTVNVSAGEITSNAATVRLGAGARFDVRNSAGSTHLVVDLQGYYTR